MGLVLDSRKTAQENATAYYDRAKEYAKKAEGARKAIEETKKEIEKAKRELEDAKKAASEDKPKMKRAKEWFEKFKWFHTSGKKLVIAGRDAKQNDNVVSKFMEEGDLFFHADIQGAPATILKGGKGASAQEKKETAEFAASHSSAWKVRAASVDVYAVEKEQLSKHASGGFVGAGGFVISGEREWFRDSRIGLAVGVRDGKFVCLPMSHPDGAKLPVEITPGSDEKGRAAKGIAKLAGAEIDDVLLALPSGGFSVKKR